MFNKPLDLLAIGDMATDAFIRLKDPSIHCTINHDNREICMPFADKVPFESVQVVKAVGNAANAAVSGARLGLRSALISNIGADPNGHECMNELQRNNVITSYIHKHENKLTNYHFVLWYEAERTILVNHVDYKYTLPKLPSAKWIYLTSLAAHTVPYHMEVLDYMEKHPEVRLAFQPGTFQMKLGFDELKRLYTHTDIFVVNVEEAQRMLKTDSRDVKDLMKKLSEYGPKLILVTDGPKGAYMYDGDHYYFMPIYPDPKEPLERTGCGDAFASTFVSALAMGKTPLEALMWAPINPMSVVQFVGAQEGLLTKEQLDWWLHKAPEDYKVKEI
ncbi:MAG: carbohydrate kinase family protein [bacterium]|nr:carbohydrate kinase family protein [bacterium]